MVFRVFCSNTNRDEQSLLFQYHLSFSVKFAVQWGDSDNLTFPIPFPVQWGDSNNLTFPIDFPVQWEDSDNLTFPIDSPVQWEDETVSSTVKTFPPRSGPVREDADTLCKTPHLPSTS